MIIPTGGAAGSGERKKPWWIEDQQKEHGQEVSREGRRVMQDQKTDH
jgi:hypothetical protein